MLIMRSRKRPIAYRSGNVSSNKGLTEFQEAQENMGKIGNRYHSVEPW